MATEFRSFKGFCSPMDPSSQSLIETIACEYARGCTELFLKRFRSDIEQESHGLVPFLEAWVDSDITFEMGWNSRIGNIRLALESKCKPLHAAALLAISLNSQGLFAEWAGHFEEPLPVIWRQMQLPGAVELTVSSNQNQCTIELRNLAGCRKVLSLRDPKAIEGLDCEILPHFLIDQHEVYFLVGNTHENLWSWEGQLERSKVSPSELSATFTEAIEIFRRHAPLYLTWVDRIIRYIIPVNSSDGELRSASNRLWPGVVELSFPSNPIATAEMLVHEASHQYLHILTRSVSLHDASDNHLYYSPVKGIGRPINAILLAFHAFSNVALFYRYCIESGLHDNGYCARNMERHLSELGVMAAHLRASGGITEVGKVLWTNLAARLQLASGSTYSICNK